MVVSRKQLTLAFAAMLVVLCLVEGLLQLTSLLVPRVATLLKPPWDVPPTALPDERLVYRPNPLHPGHDARGFSNPVALEQAEIVVLGDSQSYPTNVRAEEAWPQALASLSNRSVYSLALPGYGPVQSLMWRDEAAKLAPKHVLVTFYVGNDLYDSFNVVHNFGQHNELATKDPQLQQAIQQREALETIEARVERVYSTLQEGREDAGNARASGERRNLLRRWVADYSKIYGLIRRVRFELANFSATDPWVAARAAAIRRPEGLQIVEDGSVRTVLTPDYRLTVLDFDDPRIAEGAAISLGALQALSIWSTAQGARFTVVLIPTKESVYAARVTKPIDSLRQLLINEQRFWANTKSQLSALNIAYVDALPVLRAQLAAGNSPYPPTNDGHPNALGHLAIAKLALTAIDP